MRPATRRRIRHATPRWLLRMAGRLDEEAILEPAAPPRCPPGWSTGPPDFVGIGAQRGGTTRWFDLIASHPEVTQPSTAKELHYFDRFFAGGYTPTRAAEYQRYFPRAGDNKAGEWTPIYMSAPWIPKQLAAAAPETRLLVSLRDPVERFLSGIEHNAAIARERGVQLSRLAPLEAFMRGFYHVQLVRLLEHFDRSQILILQYERCAREPLAQLQRTFEFLGLKDTAFAPDIGARPNATRPSAKPQLDRENLESYVRAYSADVAGLIAAFPEIDVGLWPNFAQLAV